MDTSTRLIYVGNGQYYDPSTGRFLSRGANTNSTNPYVPWGGNPTGALFTPLALLSLVYTRRKKRGTLDTIIILVVLGVSLGMGLSACGTNPAPPPVITITPTPTPNGTPEVTITATATVPAPPGTPTPTITVTCTATAISGTPTPMATSGYYIPTESQAKDVDGNFKDAIPVDSTGYANQLYLTSYEYKGTANEYTNGLAGSLPPLKVYDGIIYDYNYTCLQGSAKLDLSANGHYISCNTASAWSGYISYNQNPNRAKLDIRYRWADETKIRSLKAFHTAAVCPGSPLYGKTVQIVGLPDNAMQILKDHGNSDAIFNVVDTGGRLCSTNAIDIFTGEGATAYGFDPAFYTHPVTVYQQ